MSEMFMKCAYNHPDCHANDEVAGGCVALQDMHFSKPDCPFYKSEEQWQKEHVECEARLAQIGMAKKKQMVEKCLVRSKAYVE